MANDRRARQGEPQRVLGQPIWDLGPHARQDEEQQRVMGYPIDSLGLVPPTASGSFHWHIPSGHTSDGCVAADWVLTRRMKTNHRPAGSARRGVRSACDFSGSLREPRLAARLYMIGGGRGERRPRTAQVKHGRRR